MVMAAAQRYRTRLFVAAPDDGEGGYLLFNLDLKRLFSSQEKPQPQADVDCPPPPLPLLGLPDPVACFKKVNSKEYMVFSDSPCGDLIAGIGANGRTVLYDGAAFSRGPDMTSVKHLVFLVPVGYRMFFAISAYPQYDSGPRFEALQQQPSPGGSSRWAWSAVPDPPSLACHRPEVKAYFVSGARVWVSLRYQGTYSLSHGAPPVARAEGTWQLPIDRRGVLVPDFLGTGRRLLFGFRALDGYYDENPFCAVDMDASPPAVVATWPEVYPSEQLWRAGYRTGGLIAEVGYYGGGRFCLWETNHDNAKTKTQRRSILSFMAVQLSPELHLLEHQPSNYMLPLSSRHFPADVIM